MLATEPFTGSDDPGPIGVSAEGRVIVGTSGAGGRVIGFDGWGGVERVIERSGPDVTGIVAWNERVALSSNGADDAIVEIYCGL